MPRMALAGWAGQPGRHVCVCVFTHERSNALASFSMQTASFGKRADLVQPLIAW